MFTTIVHALFCIYCEIWLHVHFDFVIHIVVNVFKIISCTCLKSLSSTGLKQSDKFILTGLNSIWLSIQTSFHTHTLTHNYSALKEDLLFQRHIIAGYEMSHSCERHVNRKEKLVHPIVTARALPCEEKTSQRIKRVKSRFSFHSFHLSILPHSVCHSPLKHVTLEVSALMFCF